METVVLTILLILALALIGVVLLQRSEGGGLGLGGGGGGGGGGVMSARGAASALAKLTWFLGIGFFVTAMTLTVLSAQRAANSSVVGDAVVPQESQPALPGNLTLPADTNLAPAPSVDDLMPPAPVNEPVVPPKAD